MSPAGSDSYLAHFRRRVLASALQEATAAYWIRRAQQFEAAAPRRGDDARRGRAPDLQASALAEAHTRCTAIAQACRARAAVAQLRSILDSDSSFAVTEDTVEQLVAPSYDRDLDLATRRLRAAIDSGDAAAIEQASAAVDQLDPAGVGTTTVWTETVPDMVRRHRRVIAALDAQTTVQEQAA